MRVFCVILFSIVSIGSFPEASALSAASAEDVAQLEATLRGNKLLRLVVLRLSKATQEERDLLVGQIVCLDGPVITRASMTGPTLFAFVEGSIRHIDPKAQTVEIDARVASFRRPKASPKSQR